MEPHHHQAIALAGLAVENDGQLGEQAGVELAEIDGVLFVAALQVLERRYPTVTFDHEKPSGVRALDQDRIDVEPTVCLDARDQVLNTLLPTPQHKPGRAPLYVGIEHAFRRDGPVIRMVHEPEVVRVEVETTERQVLPSAPSLLRGFVAHGSLPHRVGRMMVSPAARSYQQGDGGLGAKTRGA